MSQSRWLRWNPQTLPEKEEEPSKPETPSKPLGFGSPVPAESPVNLGGPPKKEPSKPSKPISDCDSPTPTEGFDGLLSFNGPSAGHAQKKTGGFDGFEGSFPRFPQKIEIQSDPEFKNEVPPVWQSEFQSAIDTFTKAGFEIKAIRDSGEDVSGIPESKWRKQHLHELCTKIRQFRPVPEGARRRPCGESALCRPHGDKKYYEWIYAPSGLMESTWVQMSELAQTGEYDFVVVAWPEARVLYDSMADGPVPISEEEPKETES